MLEESYLGTGRALGPSRLLFEVGEEGAAVGHLRRTLGLDSGYVSRLLRRLELDGLVTVEPDPRDGRQRVVHLTREGRRERSRLDDRSERLAARLVGPLPPRQRDELASALATAERIIRSATVRFEVVDPRSEVATSAIAAYFAELDARFRSGFDPGHAGAASDAHALKAPNGAFLVVTSDDDLVGCGGVQRIDGETAEIKRMWIDRAWRGLGLGRRLLERLEAEAGDLGYTSVVLDTNDSLTEAVAMYQRAGYERIERYNANPYAHHWFRKRLAPAR